MAMGRHKRRRGRTSLCGRRWATHPGPPVTITFVEHQDAPVLSFVSQWGQIIGVQAAQHEALR